MENKRFDFKKYADSLLKVTKVEDRRFNNNHPAGYNVGDEIVGLLHLLNSNQYQCLFLLKERTMYWHTSQVIGIEEHEGYDLLKTLNSTYKVEPQVVSLPEAPKKQTTSKKKTKQI